MSHVARNPLFDFPAQPLPPWRRAVLKVGSSLLAGFAAGDGGLDTRHARSLAQFVEGAYATGREVVLVSSGAVAAGRARVASGGDGLVLRQALAALGQAQLIGFWQMLFARPVAQVLLSHDDLRDRRRYLNARATLRELLRLGALPVINENDTVAVDELKLGDNDNLAAAVASLVDADLLLIATDIGGVYNADPEHDARAMPQPHLVHITPAVLGMAGAAGHIGTGGMRSKLEAASKAALAGIPTALFCGRDAAVVSALSADRLHGSLIERADNTLSARKQWLRHAPAAGQLTVDAGAAAALCAQGASLLPGGVVAVTGEFHRGDIIEVRDCAHAVPPLARGLAQYNAGEVRRIAGHKSSEIERILGFRYGEAVIHRDDLVLLVHGAAP
ncbi:MAG: glutamate 5-kinase [Metallibacterium scheffleri]|uniref:glutamate 5-kinase n=1 Tax=Metallibacterium scheffleri TaxID=993689 RepID=UPI0026E92D35|nr:glutamate 5-kinase [Metallibacterium scheffleri]MCK9367537.1 glutamate 5-kinase [Metallibacterium scheffleri]